MAAKSLVKENDKITKHYFLFIKVDNLFLSSNTKEINLFYEMAADTCVQEIGKLKPLFYNH